MRFITYSLAAVVMLGAISGIKVFRFVYKILGFETFEHFQARIAPPSALDRLTDDYVQGRIQIEEFTRRVEAHL